MGYVAPVTTHVVASEHSKLSIINQTRNLGAYARQLDALKYIMGTLKIRGSPIVQIPMGGVTKRLR